MAYGTGGFLAISRQDAFKTATSSWEYVPILSETLTTNIEQLIEESIRARYEEGPTREGLLSVAGDVTMEAHPLLIGHFLRGAIGQASNAALGDAYQTDFLPVQTDFATNCALPPYTIQVYRDVGSSYQFTDCIVNGLSFEISAGAIVRATASIIARVSSLMPYTTPTFPTGDSWTWDACSLSVVGVANADMENITLSIDNAVSGVAFLDTTKLYGKFLRDGFRKFMVSGTMDFTDQSQYNQFRSQTEQRFLINLRGSTEVASGYPEELLFDFPNVRYESYEIGIGGPNRIQASFSGNAKYNTTSQYAFKATLVNTKNNYQ